MATLREQQIAWLNHITSTSGKTLTEIARASKVDPSTISKFLSNTEGHTLTSKIVRRIEDATRVPAYESRIAPRIQSFTDNEAQPYQLDMTSDNILEHVLKDAVARSNSIDLWTLKTDQLAGLGLLPGMVVIVDRDAKPRSGDVVVVQKYDFKRGTAETIFRLWRTPYLMTAPLIGEPAYPEVVDNENIVIAGVVTGACHIRH